MKDYDHLSGEHYHERKKSKNLIQDAEADISSDTALSDSELEAVNGGFNVVETIGSEIYKVTKFGVKFYDGYTSSKKEAGTLRTHNLLGGVYQRNFNGECWLAFRAVRDAKGNWNTVARGWIEAKYCEKYTGKII